jgi:YD repeat-containing protein
VAGTVDRGVYNSLGEALSECVGASSSNWVEVSCCQYDNGGGGDGNLMQETAYPGLGAANRVTDYWYDWRDRLVAEKSGVQSDEIDGTNRPIIITAYDNLDEVIETWQYEGDGVTPQFLNGGLIYIDPSLLRADETDSYDEQGRLYQTQAWDINPSSPSPGALTTNYYYDHRGDLIAEFDPGGLWTKSVYDGAGRDVMDYSTDGAGGTTWAEASSVASDTVLEQEQTIYDAGSNVIETIDSQRFHNATGTGPLGTPTSGIGARVYYAANYYDNADRLTASVDVGTNGGTAWTGKKRGQRTFNPLRIANEHRLLLPFLEDKLAPPQLDLFERNQRLRCGICRACRAGALATSATSALAAPGTQCLPAQVQQGQHNQHDHGQQLPVHRSSTEKTANLIHRQRSDIRQHGHVRKRERRPAPAVRLAADDGQCRGALAAQREKHHQR